MKKIKLVLGLMILPFIGVSQSTTATNTQTGGQTRYLGFDNNFPLRTVPKVLTEQNSMKHLQLAPTNMTLMVTLPLETQIQL